jgi:hypothetical protein
MRGEWKGSDIHVRSGPLERPGAPFATGGVVPPETTPTPPGAAYSGAIDWMTVTGGREAPAGRPEDFVFGLESGAGRRGQNGVGAVLAREAIWTGV